jgi:LysM repeat protein
MAQQTSKGIMTYMFCKASKKCAKTMLILILFLILGAAACVQETAPSDFTATPTHLPTRSPTATPEREPENPISGRNIPLPTSPPLPTPTPLTYNIIEGDTLLGIALRHGITLDELLAVNPGIDPNFLPIGITITIPIEQSGLIVLATPTPVSLPLSTPNCYPTSDGGLWCISAVKNISDQPVENISAKVTLFTSDSSEPPVKVAITPLNLLQPGKALPLVTFFPPPVPTDAQPIIEILTALPVSADDNRYRDVKLTIQEQSISEDNLLARILGIVSLSSDSEPADLIWVTGSAYDTAGNIIGVRKWESNSGIDPGTSMPFEMNIYSLGPPIQEVEILVEAR